VIGIPFGGLQAAGRVVTLRDDRSSLDSRLRNLVEHHCSPITRLPSDSRSSQISSTAIRSHSQHPVEVASKPGTIPARPNHTSRLIKPSAPSRAIPQKPVPPAILNPATELVMHSQVDQLIGKYIVVHSTRRPPPSSSVHDDRRPSHPSPSQHVGADSVSLLDEASAHLAVLSLHSASQSPPSVMRAVHLSRPMRPLPDQ